MPLETVTRMIKNLQIEGFRGFRRFEMDGLGRVNLLVGTNNSGKTSVLEAVYLLMSLGDPASLWHVLSRRGEQFIVAAPDGDTPPRERFPQMDPSHLFTGHEARPGAKFALSAQGEAGPQLLALSVVEAPSQRPPFDSDEEGDISAGLAIRMEGNPDPVVSLLPLTRLGAIPGGFSWRTDIRRHFGRRAGVSTSLFITTESLHPRQLIEFWDQVALTPEEEMVLGALRLIDKDVERIAAQASSTAPYFPLSSRRGGFIVKLRGSDQPIPIGSLGDGMWRMLAMAIAITRCRGGALLVDEIDTGLHYSVMSQMWNLIFNAAKALDVQVFATTHSYDCVYSLAHICALADQKNPVTVQRIERGASRAIPYTEDEIKIAADREIEVR